jgi:predicted permease
VREFPGADRLGEVIRVNNVPVTVVGVVGADFDGLELGAAPPILYLPLSSAPAVGRDSIAATDGERRLAGDSDQTTAPSVFPAAAFQVLVRMPPTGRTALRAEATARLRSDEWAVVPVSQTMLPFEHAEDARRFVRVLVGSVAITVAVACFNVAILMFAGGEERSREYAIRSMLGAAPSTLARLVGVESLAIAACAGLGSGVVAWSIQKGAIALALPGTAWIDSASVEPWRAIAFAALLGLVVAALIALIPVRYAIRRGAESGRGSTVNVRQLRTLSTLVALQVGACIVMALAATLFIRAVHLRLSQDLGFRDQGLLSAEVALGGDQRNESALEYVEQTLNEVRELSGVRAAAVGPAPLLAGSDWSTSEFVIDGIPRTTESTVDMVYAGHNYFETLGQGGLRGRDFRPSDTLRSPLVVIVNAAAGRLLWRATDPLGHRIVLSMFTAPLLSREMEVVGVVPDVTLRHLGEPARPIVYLSRAQFHDYLAGFATRGGSVNLLIRSDADARTVTQQLSAVVPPHGQRLLSLVSVADVRREMVQPQRLVGALLVFLGATIGVVTIIGAYATGHMSAVRQRRANAIRIALGATSAEVVRAAVWRASRVLFGAVCGGLVVSWMVRPFLENVALGTRLFEPLTVIAATALVCLAGGLAVYLPLREIGDIEPGRLLKD